MMRRGATPTHTFTLPFSTDEVSKVRVVYSQDNRPIVVKEMEDCAFEGNDVVVELTQEDTLKFDSSKFVDIQLRVLTLAEDSLVSDIIQKAVGACLDNEVLR